jgi:hypothetical protein
MKYEEKALWLFQHGNHVKKLKFKEFSLMAMFNWRWVKNLRTLAKNDLFLLTSFQLHVVFKYITFA